MLQLTRAQLAVLRRQGIAFDEALKPTYIKPEWLQEADDETGKGGFSLAMDAQPGLITVSNAGIPAFLANMVDPQVIRVLTTPMKAAEIFGEAKKGDWTLLTAQFPVVEATGNVSSYGDFNNNGVAGANVNWVPRQSYHYQTVSRWGERELAMYGEAKISYKSEVDVSSALVIQKFMNLSWFYGIAALQNFGALNDPALSAPVTPTAAWSTLDALGVYNDIKRLVSNLIAALKGLIDMSSKMTLAMSPELEVYTTLSTSFNVNVADLLKKNFPNLTIKTAPEYSNANGAGQLMQLIVDQLDGVDTAVCAFTEKMRAHPVIQDLSSFKQKKSAGTWGYINKRPVCVAQMQGM